MAAAGWRVHQKVVQIIREEIDAIGGQETSLRPVLTPAEFWERTGRIAIPELFKLSPTGVAYRSCCPSRTRRR